MRIVLHSVLPEKTFFFPFDFMSVYSFSVVAVLYTTVDRNGSSHLIYKNAHCIFISEKKNKNKKKPTINPQKLHLQMSAHYLFQTTAGREPNFKEVKKNQSL